MRKKELLSVLEKRKGRLKFQQFSMVVVFGSVSLMILADFFGSINDIQPLTNLLLAGLAMAVLCALMMRTGWVGYRYYADKITDVDKIITIAKKKKEDILEKQWKNEAGLPLIKACENFYVLPGEEHYDKVLTNKVFFTEAGALTNFYSPREDNREM